VQVSHMFTLWQQLNAPIERTVRLSVGCTGNVAVLGKVPVLLPGCRERYRYCYRSGGKGTRNSTGVSPGDGTVG
jgi:hypothetical protein